MPAFFLSGEGIESYTLILWALSIFLLGLPHGASDWLLYRSVFPRHSYREWAVFIGGYSLLAVLFAVFWWAAPHYACFSFLCITAWHWGSGDSNDFQKKRFGWILASLSRGCIQMLAPIVFHPAASQVFVEQLIGVFGNEATIILPYKSGALLLATSIFIECTTWLWAIVNQQIKKRKAVQHLFETFALLGLFYYLPPLLSVGIYFLWLHALRHSLRLLERCSFNHARNVLINLSILHLRSFLFVAPVLLVLFVWFFAHPAFLYLNVKSIAEYLVVIAALTFPHAILITALDLREAIE